jgi:glycosyltransferase involved in cell wall biosynthesis
VRICSLRELKVSQVVATVNQLNLSVILCTHNRCDLLKKALESVAASTVPQSVEWEVLIVDNNSSDQTRQVAQQYCEQYPGRFRYLFEEKQGKSYALNTGIREAHGKILAFMDDDVTVEPTWLWNLTSGLQSGEWAGAGGRIFPQTAFTPPRWLTLDGPHGMRGVLVLLDLGETPGEISVIPYGTNMAFRREMFDKYGVFRTDLGPSPHNELRHEDTEFCRRLLSDGKRLRYEPSAIVYHPVPESRLQKEYFLEWWFDVGRAQIREAGKRPAIWGIARYYFRIPRVLLSRLPMRTMQWMFAVDPQKRFMRKCWLWTTAGEVVEMYRVTRRPEMLVQSYKTQT